VVLLAPVVMGAAKFNYGMEIEMRITSAPRSYTVSLEQI